MASKTGRPRRRRATLLPRMAVLATLVATAMVATLMSSERLGWTDGGRAAAKAGEEEAGADVDGGDPLCGGPVTVNCEQNIAESERLLWIFFYSMGTVYVFIALAVVCDDFFVPSLEVICEELQLTKDVAGATFMAAGSSAPELFTSIMGVFYQKSDVGIGTILGSAVFNILVIIGLTALLAGQDLVLDWRPLARDSTFYMVSIVLIMVMFEDQIITQLEAISLILFYLCYLVAMKFNPQLMDFLKGMTTKAPEPEPEPSKGERAPSVDLVEDDDNDPLEFPDEMGEQLLWCVSLPLLVAFKYTIPDCGKEEHRKKYLISFFMSIAWIGASCFFMADWARSLGCLLNIPPEVMGLTLLAAGTSVPDALASLFVAQDGEGDMAVANAIGSNVFDILLGLGLPWTISILMDGNPVPVCGEGILKASFILFLVLVGVIGSLMCNKWVLTPRVGGFLFLMYFVFVVFSLADNFYHLI